jgi:hypothetical protein
MFRRRKTKYLAGSFIFILAMTISFSDQIDHGLWCLAYYDQCTAERIEGLTIKECFDRADNEAYLLDHKVCLVRKSN